jgi:hypothetical protein
MPEEGGVHEHTDHDARGQSSDTNMANQGAEGGVRRRSALRRHGLKRRVPSNEGPKKSVFTSLRMNPDAAESALEDNLETYADTLASRDVEMYLPRQQPHLSGEQQMAAQTDTKHRSAADKGGDDDAAMTVSEAVACWYERLGQELKALPGMEAKPGVEWPEVAQRALHRARDKAAATL